MAEVSPGDERGETSAVPRLRAAFIGNFGKYGDSSPRERYYSVFMRINSNSFISFQDLAP